MQAKRSSTPGPSGKRRGGPWRWLLVGVAAVASVVVGTACRSLPKDELEEALLALDKNAPVRGALRRMPLSVDLGDGERELGLVYWHVPAARPSGLAPVVLVHGTPSTLFTWVGLATGGEDFEGLAATRDVYAIEVVGHGIAPGDGSPYTFDRCARFVAAAVEALELDPAHVVGQSYGGEFAWRAVLDRPELFASLTIMNSSGVARRDEDWLSEEEVMRDLPGAHLGWVLNSRSRIEAALEPHFAVVPPERAEEFFLVCENAHDWGAMIDLARDENGDREAELPRIARPTLALWGAADIAYVPDHYAAAFVAAIPGARRVDLAGLGHYPQEEDPAAVAAALEAFWQDL